MNNIETLKQQLPWSPVWPKRQEVQQQWALTVLVLIESVKKTNVVIVHPNQRVWFVQYNPYVIEVDRRRNCYSCGGFGYLAQNCRRQIIDQGKRMEYENNGNYKQNNLNGGEI